jgi:alkanesulfonate monooxygenase SsuD/methylene tetrahydromethanopterin reductase-like flavin-dependent oxidoreductase (luciferase family)
VLRSACLLVGLEGRSERRYGENPVTPVTGSPDAIAAVVRELGEAGADEVILVVDPITERSVRELGEVVAQIS